jgi:hypothetical protein
MAIPTWPSLIRRSGVCAMGGCGLIVYWLEEPFTRFNYDTPSPQYGEFHRHSTDLSWIDSLVQTGDQRLRVEPSRRAPHVCQTRRIQRRLGRPGAVAPLARRRRRNPPQYHAIWKRRGRVWPGAANPAARGCSHTRSSACARPLGR